MDGSRIIWAATKTAENSYKFRTGIRWPLRFQPATGAEMQVKADRGGDIQAVPVALWANISIRDVHNAVEDHDLQLQARLNGDDADESFVQDASLRYYDSNSWIATPEVTLTSVRALTARLDTTGSNALEASQSFGVAIPDFRLKTVASLAANLPSQSCAASLKLESRLTAHWTFSASLTDLQRLAQSTKDEPDMRMRLSYNRRW
ncbi:hypothetical protein ACU5AY_09510 [Rhizobium sp. PAMB 3174]